MYNKVSGVFNLYHLDVKEVSVVVVEGGVKRHLRSHYTCHLMYVCKISTNLKLNLVTRGISCLLFKDL